MKSETRHALKEDALAKAAASSASWIGAHRAGVVRWVVIAAVVLVLGVGGLVAWSWQSGKADAALNEALDTYSAPLQQEGQPAVSGTYKTAAERAQKAHDEFAGVVSSYGFFGAAKKAKYFVGVTSLELGKTQDAEATFKDVKDGSGIELGNLARVALANLYHNEKRDAEAIALWQEMIAKPSETVSAATAELQLAGVYDAAGQKDQAKALWAKVKDADKDGPAGAAASQKLGK